MKNDIFYMDGFGHALRNAMSLMEIALSASELGNYGAGVSLCILSSEESIKAVFALQQSVDSDNKISDFEKVFKNHKIKHEYLEEFVKQIDRFRVRLLEEYKKVAYDRQSRRSVAKKNPEIQETIDWATNHYKSVPEILYTLQWFKDANVEKNKGLYLDLRNGEWQIPLEIDPGIFKKAMKNAKEIYGYARFSEKILANTSR